MERLPALLCRVPRAQPLLSRQIFHPPQFYVFTRSMASKASTPDARIHILGAGNLGQYLARGLVKQNPQLPVTLLFHRAGLLRDWEAAGKEIECVTDGVVDRTGGIDVELLDGREGEAAPIRHLIVACKTYTVVSALKQIRDRLDENSTIVFLQNGMGTTDEVSKELFPNASTRPAYWAGIAVLGVTSTEPFSIIPAGRGHITLGPVAEDLNPAPSAKPSPSPRRSGESGNPQGNLLIEQLAQIDDPASAVVTPAELRKAQLLKLMANSIINPLTVVLNCKNGELVGHRRVHQLIRNFVAEAGPVIRSLLPPGEPIEGDEAPFSDKKLLDYVEMVVDKTAANTSSMLQDVRSGKTTEIDYINGFIASEGKRLNLECKKHEILVDMVKKGETLRPKDVLSRFGLEEGVWCWTP